MNQEMYHNKNSLEREFKLSVKDNKVDRQKIKIIRVLKNKKALQILEGFFYARVFSPICWRHMA